MREFEGLDEPLCSNCESSRSFASAAALES